MYFLWLSYISISNWQWETFFVAHNYPDGKKVPPFLELEYLLSLHWGRSCSFLLTSGLALKHCFTTATVSVRPSLLYTPQSNAYSSHLPHTWCWFYHADVSWGAEILKCNVILIFHFLFNHKSSGILKFFRLDIIYQLMH